MRFDEMNFNAIQNWIDDTLSEFRRPSFLYKPTLKRDGNMWEALYGSDPMEGVVAYGESPEKALREFDKAWTSKAFYKSDVWTE